MKSSLIKISACLPVVLLLGACAHDPDPFARERSLQEQQQDERMALQQSETEMERQRLEAARASDNSAAAQQTRQGQGGSPGVEAADAADAAERDAARRAVRQTTATIQRVELPTPTVGRVLTVPKLLSR